MRASRIARLGNRKKKILESLNATEKEVISHIVTNVPEGRDGAKTGHPFFSDKQAKDEGLRDNDGRKRNGLKSQKEARRAGRAGGSRGRGRPLDSGTKKGGDKVRSDFRHETLKRSSDYVAASQTLSGKKKKK